jgi:hypothetical protein
VSELSWGGETRPTRAYRIRQLNKYNFDVRRPRGSIEGLLTGRPQVQRAFVELVKNPTNRNNAIFRRTLFPNTPHRLGSIQFANLKTRGRSIGPLSGHGDGVTQHNEFSYRIEKPDLQFAKILLDSPKLALSLASMVGNHDNAAVQRNFNKVFARECGVQLGEGSTRVDRINIELGKVVLTGWDSLSAFAEPAETARGTRDYRALTAPVSRGHGHPDPLPTAAVTNCQRTSSPARWTAPLQPGCGRWR